MIEPEVPCMRCGGKMPAGDALFDEVQSVFFCDIDCFSEWADMNFEVVVEHYIKSNIM